MNFDEIKSFYLEQTDEWDPDYSGMSFHQNRPSHYKF